MDNKIITFILFLIEIRYLLHSLLLKEFFLRNSKVYRIIKHEVHVHMAQINSRIQDFTL